MLLHSRKVCILCLLVIAFSCSKKDAPSPDTVFTPEVNQRENDFVVSPEEAQAILSVGFLSPSNANARVASTKRVKDVKTLVNQNKQTVLYLSNYENGEGWTILAGDRRMTPVLAYSERGSFDLNTANPGIKIWLGWVESNFKDMQTKEKVDPAIASIWEKYDVALGKSDGTRISGSGCPVDQLPPSIIRSHLTDALSQWEQGTGYNFYSPIGFPVNNCTFDCGRAPTGCGPVAVAHVLRFHARQVTIDGTTYYPTTFAAMPRRVNSNCNLTNPDTLNVPRLIRGAGKGLFTVYNTQFGSTQSMTGCQTWSVPGGIDDFFSGLGFTSYDRDFSSNVHLLESQLTNSKPVIVYGASCDVCFNTMHIWVVDGINVQWGWVHLPPEQCLDEPESRKGISNNSRTTAKQCCYATKFVYYQMNWGWDPTHNNGYFTIPISYSGTTYNNAGMKMYIVN